MRPEYKIERVTASTFANKYASAFILSQPSDKRSRQPVENILDAFWRQKYFDELAFHVAGLEPKMIPSFKRSAIGLSHTNVTDPRTKHGPTISGATATFDFNIHGFLRC
jgi:hypothetical protein